MKNYRWYINLLLITGSLLLFFGVTLQADAIDIFSIPWKNAMIYQKSLMPSEWETLNSMDEWTEYRIRVSLSDDNRSLIGYQEVLFINKSNSTLNEIYFRMFPNMNGGSMWITEIMVNQKAVEGETSVENTVLRIPFDKPVPPGKQLKLSMHFKVSYPDSLSGNYGQFAYYKNVLVSANFFPMIPLYKKGKWQITLPPSHADYVSSQAALFTVQISTPKTTKLAATGTEIDNVVSQNRKTTTFVIGPARDFYFSASNNFEKLVRNYGDLTIESYAFPNHQVGAEIAMKIASDAIEYLNERFGKYPYRNFKIISAPTMALGIEYPGATVIAQKFYDLEKRFGGVPGYIIIRTTIVHEVIHQWFYNMVGNDQVEEPWVDESIAQYTTWRYFLDRGENPTARGLKLYYFNRLKSASNDRLPIGLPAYHYSSRDYSPIVYSKGPLFYMELEKYIGKNKIDFFHKQYFEKFKWKVATGKDIQAEVKAACDCVVDDIFNHWIWGN